MRKAREAFNKALELNPNNQQAVLLLARLEAAEGSLEAAVKRVEESYAKNKKNIRLGMILATLYEYNKQSEKARGIYEQVLEMRPDVWIAANNLAYYLADKEPTKENLDRALELIEPLLEKHSDRLEIADTGAWVYYRMGNFLKAREILMKVMEEGQERPAFNYHMGMIHLGLGDKEAAKQYLQKAVDSAGDFPQKENARQELDKLT